MKTRRGIQAARRAEYAKRSGHTRRAEAFVANLMAADAKTPTTLGIKEGFAMIDEYGREVDSRAYAMKLWKELAG